MSIRESRPTGANPVPGGRTRYTFERSTPLELQ